MYPGGRAFDGNESGMGTCLCCSYVLEKSEQTSSDPILLFKIKINEGKADILPCTRPIK